jgi:hypothetical protein
MRTLPLLLALIGVSACSDDGGGTNNPGPDAAVPIDSGSPGCDPATVLPSAYRPIAMVSTGAVTVTTDAGVTAGTIDGTAGGTANSADRPYIYVNLATGARVDVDDLAARTSNDWDIALKRSSIRINGGDSGAGNRKLAKVSAGDLAAVTAAPTTGYVADDFTTADCMLESLPGGEPSTAFGQWYDYNETTHALTPFEEVYVLERGDGSHVAFRIDSYYGDAAMPMRGAFYKVEWKSL